MGVFDIDDEAYEGDLAGGGGWSLNVLGKDELQISVELLKDKKDVVAMFTSAEAVRLRDGLTLLIDYLAEHPSGDA